MNATQIASVSDNLKLQNKMVLRFNEIKSFIDTNRKALGIPKNLSPPKVIETLIRERILLKIQLSLGVRKEPRFILGQPSPYEVALLLRPDSYFTHQTAVHINGLLSNVPKAIFVNAEQPQKERYGNELEQENIDNAFRAKQRQSKSLAKYKGKEIRLLSGMNTDQLGVIEREEKDGTTTRYTDLERTLIDIAVRPAYSGGVGEVLQAYKKALSMVSFKKLGEYLTKLDYKYPYHQAIGFYAQRAGKCSPSDLLSLKQFGLKYNFYLAHAMKHTIFDPEWRIHYPSELNE